jgi:hypothetical protein
MDSRIRGNDGAVRSPVADRLAGEAKTPGVLFR